MKVRPWLAVFTALSSISIVPIGEAEATTISGRSSTVLEWTSNTAEDRYESNSKSSDSAPIYQYLLLNANDLSDTGTNFKLYGRLGTDLNNVTDAESRLYYAYIEKKNINNNLDVRVGRQFFSTTAGASLMDGIQAQFKDIGPASIKIFGGGDVRFEEYDSDDLIFGTEISFRAPDFYNFSLSYLQKREDDLVANQLFGAEIYYNVRDIVNFYSEAQYNYPKNSISYFLGGMKYYRPQKWSLQAEYLYSVPVFHDTSIYSVFAAEEYQEASAELNYRICLGLNSYFRYSQELYKEYADANVYEIGIEKTRTDRMLGYLAGVYRDDGGNEDLTGVKGHIAYFFNKYFQIGIGAHLDVYSREINEYDRDDDEVTSSRLWTDVVTNITDKVNLTAKLERIESDNWKQYHQGRLRLNVRF